MIRRTALATGLLALSLFACSSDDGGEPAGDEMVLYPTTKILDGASLALVTETSPDLATLGFDGRTPAIQSIAVGDVVMGGVSTKTPHGVLRRVTAVDRNGSATKLTTERAGIADAIERGRIRLPRTPLRKDGAALRPQTETGFDLDQDFTLGLSDIDLGYGAKAGVSVGFGLGIDVDLTVSAKEVSGKIVLSGNESATVDVHGKVASEFDEKLPLGGVDFPPIAFQVGPVPIVITSGLSAGVGLEGKASAAFDWSATEKAYMNAGLEVGTSGVDPIIDGEATATADPPRLHGNLDARAYVELKLDVAINTLLVDAAFYVGAQGFVRLGVDTSKTADCFVMSRGIDAIYGIDTSLLGMFTIYKKDGRSNLFDTPFVSGSCTQDPLAVAPWAKAVGASDLDKLPSIALQSDQSIVLGMSTAGSGGYVARLSPQGDALWENDLGGVVGYGVHVSPAVSNDGRSWVFGSSQTKPIAMKLGPKGAREAASVIGTAGAPRPDGAKFVASRDGGILMGGAALDASSTYVEWAAKLDATGKVVWSSSYGPVSEVRAIAEANDGGILLVGDSVVSPGAATHVSRITPNGELVFSKTYGAGRLYGVTAVASGGLAATGSTAQGNGGIVLRIADDGALTWGFSYVDTSAEKAIYQGRAILERSDGFLVGGRRGFGESADFWALQVSPNGELGWSRSYGGSKNDEVTSMARTSDNGAVLAGETYSFGGTAHAMLVRIPPSGAFEFTAGSGGVTRNVEGAKEPLPGSPTTISATGTPMNATSAPAEADHWPLEARPALHEPL